MFTTKRSGYTLAELLVGLGVAAALLAVVLQEPARDLVAPNERAAIAALRRVASAQARLASSGAIDTDDDGVGEYGYFGELAGSAPLRVYNPVNGSPTLGAAVLSPPLLPRAFRQSFFDLTGDNVVRVDGYFFKMFLPGAPILDHIGGVPETGVAGMGGATAAGFPYPDTGEVLWCCYAWPVEPGVTGRRAFFINQEGRILRTRNDGHARDPVYEGIVSVPDFDAAYSNQPGSPNGLTGMGAPLGTSPREANDGNVWTPIDR